MSAEEATPDNVVEIREKLREIREQVEKLVRVLCHVVCTRFCRDMGYIAFTRSFGLGFYSAQISVQKIGWWRLCRPHSRP